MDQTKQRNVISYFSNKMNAARSQIAALEQDERRDEAVFAKIRLNVYDIFHTVFSVAMNTAQGDDDRAAALFLTKLDQIPQSWRSSLELAQQHGNSEKAHIERIKLDTAAEIRRAFESIWEVQP